MISDRFSGRCPCALAEGLGLYSALQFPYLIVDSGLGAFRLSGAQDQGSSAPPKGQRTAPGRWRPAKRRRSLRHPQEKRRASTASAAGEAQEGRGHAGLFHPRGRAVVEVPVMVTTKDGQFISSLKKENFRISKTACRRRSATSRSRRRPSPPSCWSNSPAGRLFLHERHPAMRPTRS